MPVIICDLCNQAGPAVCVLVICALHVICAGHIRYYIVVVVDPVDGHCNCRSVVAQLIRPQLARVYWHSWSYWMQWLTVSDTFRHLILAGIWLVVFIQCLSDLKFGTQIPMNSSISNINGSKISNNSWNSFIDYMLCHWPRKSAHM